LQDRLPPLIWHSTDCADGVRNGSDQVRPEHGIGTETISDNQRRPLVLTKNPLGDWTGSR
jgi:hypothetical protein